MKQWLISKIPTWFLRHLVWLTWANIELWLRAEDRGTTVLGPVNPAGVPEWLLTNSKSYGYEDEPDDQITTSVRGPLGLTSEQRRHLIRWRDRR